MNRKQNGLEIELRGGVFYLAGSLNEYADLSVIKEAEEPIVLDLKDLTWINSIGIRNLAQLIKNLNGKMIRYQNCSVSFVDHLNSVPILSGPMGKAETYVNSLYLPFYCDGCNHEWDRFYQVRDFYVDGKLVKPKTVCPSCKKEVEADEGNLLFLSR